MYTGENAEARETAVGSIAVDEINAANDICSGIASGVNNAVSRTAALLALALLGLIYLEVANFGFGKRVVALNLTSSTTAMLLEQSLNFASLDLPATLSEEERRLAQASADGAFVFAYRVVNLIAAALAALSALLAGLMIKPQKQRSQAATVSPVSATTDGK